MSFFEQDDLTALEAKAEAERLAFAPIMFQVCRVARDTGLLEAVQRAGSAGIEEAHLLERIDVPEYGMRVLLEAGLGVGIFRLRTGRYTLTKLGYFVMRDPMTRVNMDVVHEICYQGMFRLDTAIEEGRPAGLEALGNWKTLYEGLSSLPPKLAETWLAWDHYYSDRAFPAALPIVFEDRPARILDVGGNTGKWAIACAQHDPDVKITIVDLPQQIAMARKIVADRGLSDRITFEARDVLDESAKFPTGFDTIWMSQFLDCFSAAEIVSILRRAASAMGPDSVLYILDLHWDRQPNEVAAFCLQQISIYFACIANGRSRMYHSADFEAYIRDSGLVVLSQRDQVGGYHTLWKCGLQPRA